MMSVAGLSVIPSPFAPVRRRGRPGVTDDAVERAKHIECAGLLLGRKFSAKRVALLFGISRRTVYNWTKLALSYDEPESEGLRRLTR